MGPCHTASTQNKHHISQPAQPSSSRAEKESLEKSPRQLTEEEYFSKYEELNVIGHGTRSKMTLARHREDAVLRAVKRVKTASYHIELKVSTLKELDHPNIVKVFEVYRGPKFLYIVMEYCEGGELINRILENEKITELEVASYIRDVVLALIYLNAHGVVHRGLKPENLLLETTLPNSALKISNFDHSVYRSSTSGLETTVGTPYYMAPEMLTGNYNEKCDIWSLGVIVFLLLSGVPPFIGNSFTEIFQCILSNKPVFGHAEWGHISQEAVQLVSKMLNKNPVQRPSAAEIYYDPWLLQGLKGNECSSGEVYSVCRGLRSFNSLSKIERATLSLISSQWLTVEEKGRLTDIFEQFDTTHSGTLSRRELKLARDKYHLGFDIDEVLDQFSVETGECIGYSDFITAAMDWQTVLDQERIHAAFRVFDTNRDGAISAEELAAVVGSGDSHYLHRIIQAMDTDKDGKIDLQEFTAYITENVLTKRTV